MEAPIPKKIEESVVAMEVATPKKVATPKISDKSNVVRASQDRSLGRPLDWLPPGWKVEFCERKNGTVPDKYYIDPVSGYKFRSRKDVSRYLENGVFPPRAGKKRKVNDAELSGQGVLSLSSVDKRQKLACRSTTKGLFPGENDLQNSAVTPNSAVREEEKPSEGRASHQCMEGLECRDKSDESKSRENYMVDEVTHALPLSVFSPQQHAMGKRGKGKPKPKPERKKSERKNDPANRKLRPAPIKSRNRKESTLPCRTSRRLAEIKPKEVDNDVPKVRAEVDTVGLEEEVNEVGKTPVGENDSMIEENIQRLESNDTESVIAMLFGESSSSMDPCLEFAYRTLAGIIPDGESPC
ncbi:Methyl-CpG-binding domain protein 5 [Ranunculus cassubicifolius]